MKLKCFYMNCIIKWATTKTTKYY